MSRPKAKEPRDQQLNLSLTARELETIKRRAAALGMCPGHLGRALILDPSRDAPTKRPEARNANRLIYGQLARLGNNLNQLVRHLHKTGDPLPPDLEPLLRDIRQVMERVRPDDH
jgi:hypothetical protein